MTFYAENETSYVFDFDWESIYHEVALAVLDSEKCPYEAEVNLLLTDNDGIQEFNRENRNIDAPTDVLSFPNIEYDVAANFENVEDYMADYFEPDSGELILGDIIISIDKCNILWATKKANSLFWLCPYSKACCCTLSIEIIISPKINSPESGSK